MDTFHPKKSFIGILYHAFTQPLGKVHPIHQVV